MTLGLLLLHALPLDGTMWNGLRDLLPTATSAPTLYGFGDTLEDWARGALETTDAERLIVVGCSVGGSCAIEVAIAAPERVAALVLIGTKARRRLDPAQRRQAVDIIHERGLNEAWRTFWQPLISTSASLDVIEQVKNITLAQSPADVARGVEVFHTRPSRDAFLPAFQKPVVIVTGADDIAPGYATSAVQAREAPRGRLHVEPACGHYVPLEKPDAIRAILAELVAELA